MLAVSELEGVIFILNLNGVSEILSVGTGKKLWHERAPCVRRACVTKVCMYNVHACGRKACMHQEIKVGLKLLTSFILRSRWTVEG